MGHGLVHALAIIPVGMAAANALGRFFGRLMSGLIYQWGGLLWALVGLALMLRVCWLLTLALPTQLSSPKPQTS